MGFPDRLKLSLSASGKTQRDVSKYLNVAESTVSQWAKGKRLPDLMTADRLADYLRVSVDYLMGRTDDPQSKGRSITRELADQTSERDSRETATGVDEVVVFVRGKQQELTPRDIRIIKAVLEPEPQEASRR